MRYKIEQDKIVPIKSKVESDQYVLDHQIVCPKGHSEAFEVHGEVSYNLGTMKIVDGMGRIVPGTDPHVNSTSYKCCVCKIFFTVKYKEGKIYRE